MSQIDPSIIRKGKQTRHSIDHFGKEKGVPIPCKE